MGHTESIHPDPEVLAAFGLGRLDPAAQAVVERHVAGCAACCLTLGAVADDRLVVLLRQANTPPHGSAPGPGPGPELPRELLDHPRYRIVRWLGAGGMGVVYQSEHRLMERPVALKVLDGRCIGHPRALERFRLEVKAAARLSHPNIVTIYDAEQAGDLHFLVMEYVEGTSLERLVETRGPLPVADACHHAQQAALGLQHAFERGMVHRDIKPQNLMLTRTGQVKILDFGLARFRQGEESDATWADDDVAPRAALSLTPSGMVLGTPDFIAPEQARNPRAADIRADIYSLGCTLYFMLTSMAPFPTGTAVEKMLAHLREAPRPLDQLRADVPIELIAVVARMMEKDPALRYQTPADVATALAPFAKSHSTTRPVHVAWPPESPAPSPVPAPDRPAPYRAGGRTVRLLSMVAVGALAALAIAAAMQFGVRSSRPGHPNPAPSRPPDRVVTPAASAPASAPLQPSEPVAAPAAPASRSPCVLMVLAGPGFFNPDYAPVRRILEQGGVHVRVASPGRGPIPPWTPGPGSPVLPDLLLSEARADDYDAVVFVGGQVAPLLGNTEGAGQARRFVAEMLRSPRKNVTAICRGTAILADLGILEGHSAAWNDFWPDGVEKSQGVAWSNAPVVISGPIVTARDWDCAGEFATVLLKILMSH
jgi:serine/threonine protein kinase/putative intracellular protease/amidase